jgi:hypothetical protein
MTPELKTSCEVVFQEHKTSATPIAWNKDAFRGRMSIGLCEMAKETLVQKKVIYFPKPPKKTITILNPVVARAATFEEAVAMIENKISLPVEVKEETAYAGIPVSENKNYTRPGTGVLVKNNGKPQTVVTEEKWHLRPFFFYVVWPVSAAIVSVLIAHFMSVWVEMAYR